MFLQVAGHSVDEVLDALRQLPWLAHGLVVFALICGVILWMYGRKVLKPGIVVLFALMGGAAGLILPPLTNTGGPNSIYVGLAVGLICGALLGVLLFRFAMAVGFGLVLGIVAPIIGAAAIGIHITGDHTSSPRPADPSHASALHEADGDPDSETKALTDELLRRGAKIRDTINSLQPTTTDDQTPADGSKEPDADHRPIDQIVDQAVKNAWERVRAFLQALHDEVGPMWTALPTSHQMVLGGSTALGFAAGFILGMLLPKWAAGSVTAMLGAAVWLPSAVWLSTATEAPWASHLQRTPVEWLVIWAAVSLIGMLIQWRGLFKSKPKVKHAKVVIE